MSQFHHPHQLDGHEHLSTFDFTLFRSDETPVYHAHPATQPLPCTKPNNAVPSRTGQPRQDNLMLRSHFDFAFDSLSGVNTDFLQPDSLSTSLAPRTTPLGFQGLGPPPINQFLTDQNSPWTGLGVGPTSNNQNFSAVFAGPNLDLRTYRFQPHSEIESNITAQGYSDSGYGSQPVASQSVQSVKYSSQSPEFNLLPDFDNFELSPMPRPSVSPRQLEEEEPLKPTQRSRGGKRKCGKCGEILKCPSDYRKHMLKHDKPNKCEIPGCSRVDGFSTINDLQRHQKSKHGIGLDSITTSFKCASPSCKNQEKIWPRRDNFKQHILRMHKEEDVNELIARSEIKSGTSSDGASIEADLAGISRYTEPPPHTVRPGELEIGISETLETSDAMWNPSTISAGSVPHRYIAIPARTRDAPGYNDHDFSNFTGLRGDHASLQSLDVLATASDFHPTFDATKIVSNLAHGVRSEMASSLATPNGQLAYNSIESQQGSDPLYFAMLQRFQQRTNEEREMILKYPTASGEERRRICQRLYPGRVRAGAQRVICKYRGCGKFFEKKAALSKHEERHRKPWQCTERECNKIFGSKDDWKRHERGSHNPSTEKWFCHLPDPEPSSPSSKTCAVVEYDREEFKEHLCEDHKMMSSTQVENMLLECKIGYSHQWQNAYYQVNYWCGFCRKIICADHDPDKKVGPGLNGKEKSDNEPANHRWDHISTHFKPEGKIMDKDWVSLEAYAAKNPSETQFYWDHEGRENPKKAERKKRQSEIEKEKQENLADGLSSPQTGHKRKADHQLTRPERRPRGNTKQVLNWICCECENGPISISIHPSCPGTFGTQCGHERCDRCEGNYANDGGEDEILARGPYDSWNRYKDNITPLAEDIMDYQDCGPQRGRARQLGMS